MPKVKIKNFLGTIESFLQNAATGIRTWVIPDKDGTFAMLDDLDDFVTEAEATTMDDTILDLANQYTNAKASAIPSKPSVDVLRDTALPAFTVVPYPTSVRTQLVANVNGYFPSTDGVLNDATHTIDSFLYTGGTGADKKYNGPYVVTQKGNPGTLPWIATRHENYQNPSAVNPADRAEITIKKGTVNTGKKFQQTVSNLVVDTDDPEFLDITPGSGNSETFALVLSMRNFYNY